MLGIFFKLIIWFLFLKLVIWLKFKYWYKLFVKGFIFFFIIFKYLFILGICFNSVYIAVNFVEFKYIWVFLFIWLLKFLVEVENIVILFLICVWFFIYKEYFGIFICVLVVVKILYIFFFCNCFLFMWVGGYIYNIFLICFVFFNIFVVVW